MMVKSCPKCVYFIGKESTDPRWEWTHCKAGIQNLTKTSAQRCNDYAETIKDALEIELQNIIKRRGWAGKCPTCGTNIKLKVRLDG